MSTSEPPIIEDEPYTGLYQGARQPILHDRKDNHLPDRFDLAEILKKTRESMGLSLDEVADITRVRRAYLEAFEQAAYDVLPPRAFAIGYVKAYAKALGLDEETLADMFKRDVVAAPARLQAPSGASLEDVKPNYRLYIGAALCLVAAVVVWNIVQRQPNLRFGGGNHDDSISAKPWTIAGLPNTLNGAIFVGQPQPAPQDQDVPAPYATPGLEAGFASLQAESSTSTPVPVQDALQMRKAFNPRGAVYGASPESSTVTIQASRMVNLVVRSTDGTVYFAHSLGAGEAYRIPAVDQQNLLLDVSDSTAFEIYYNGEYAGGLVSMSPAEGVKALVAPIAKVNGKAAQLAAALDQRQAQAGQVVGAPKTTSAPIAPLTAAKPTGPLPYLPSQRPTEPPATETASSLATPVVPVPAENQ